MLDIRLPIGAMFAVLGMLLTVYGIATFANEPLYERSLGLNVNLWWGLIMLTFGAVMFRLGRTGTSSARPASDSVEGRRTEEREHRTGLERENRRGGN
jgi:hypothetical protein